MVWSKLLGLAAPAASVGLLYWSQSAKFTQGYALLAEEVKESETKADAKNEQNPKKFSVREDFVAFANRAVTPWHAVSECVERLKNAGFVERFETDQWRVLPMGKYYVKRNDSTIFAFAVGGKFVPGSGGFSIIAAHTGSPALQIKPRSKICNAGFLQLDVTPYSNGIWRSWFDRDLALAGRLFLKTDRGQIVSKLVHINAPVLCIPSLAIDLDPDCSKFAFSREDHLTPIIASQAVHKHQVAFYNVLEGAVAHNEMGSDDDHDKTLLRLLARWASCQPADILDFDLRLVDHQPARLTGLYNEFISGVRLDNLVGVYTAMTALIRSVIEGDTLAQDPNIRLVMLCDHEKPARSSLTEGILRRLTYRVDDSAAFERTVPKSMIISADQVPAVHPNYAAKHEANHTACLHGGVVVSFSANQRLATDAYSFSVIQEVARKANIPLQKYALHNDSPCAPTIGPTLAAHLAIPTVHVGTATLAMHSIREMVDTTSIWQTQLLYKTFFETYPRVADAYCTGSVRGIPNLVLVYDRK